MQAKQEALMVRQPAAQGLDQLRARGASSRAHQVGKHGEPILIA